MANPRPLTATPTTSNRPRARAIGAPPPSSALKGKSSGAPALLASPSPSVSDVDALEDDGDGGGLENDGTGTDCEDGSGEDAGDGGSSDSGSESGDGIAAEAAGRLMDLLGPDEVPEEELEVLAAAAASGQDEAGSAGSERDELGPISSSGEEDGEDYEAMHIDSGNEDVGATVRRKVIKNDETALLRLLEGLKPSSPLNLDFFETHISSLDQSLTIADVDDDINRELALYKHALIGAEEAYSRFLSADRPFFRPSDYFAEMVKSDAQMEKIRSQLVDEAAALKASEEARRLRGLKKFGKAVQVEKRIEREKEAKRVKESVSELRKKRKGAALDTKANEDEFDIALEDALDSHDRPSKRARQESNSRAGGGGKRGMPRSARDAKFGRPKPTGLKGRRWKENTKESAGSFAGLGGKGDGKGGRTGSAASRGGKAGRGRAPRMGKSKRVSKR